MILLVPKKKDGLLGVESGTLTVLFSDGAVRLVRGEFNDSVLYYRLFISEPATLVSAADDVDGGDLRLSDWPFCDDVETTAPSETTVPTETTSLGRFRSGSSRPASR